jgi:sigma54-dependent transcription regulator
LTERQQRLVDITTAMASNQRTQALHLTGARYQAVRLVATSRRHRRQEHRANNETCSA